MATCDSGPMFLKAINCEGETKNASFIANLLDECIREIGPQNVVQVITDNASACKAAGQIIEAKYSHIFWTPCVVHTLNLALKNICTPKASPNNDVWGQCIWISDVADECWAVKNYIMNHQMRLAMFNHHSKLKFLSIADTRFASIIVMMRRYREIKVELQRMVVSEEWDAYQEDNVEKAKCIKEKILDDVLWSKIDYILSFTYPIYDMLRKCDTDMPCLHLVYEWWDSMIGDVKVAIYKKEGKQLYEDSEFFNAVNEVLLQRWTKSNTPLHCLAHSLNPRYYTTEWLVPNRVAPHQDQGITLQRQKCFERLFPNDLDRMHAREEYAAFSGGIDHFSNADSLIDRGRMQS
ncbi:uncharacterized protein LOC110748227, partial [Prunus avium]|uniref:Uncharacterized protein LOC110748227 n=1 Tax=Prunus avium TaxID=42229 RepID=A0A6P5RGB2_PRUAV